MQQESSKSYVMAPRYSSPKVPITTAQALLAIDFLDLISSCLIRDPIPGSHNLIVSYGLYFWLTVVAPGFIKRP